MKNIPLPILLKKMLPLIYVAALALTVLIVYLRLFHLPAGSGDYYQPVQSTAAYPGPENIRSYSKPDFPFTEIPAGHQGNLAGE